MRKERAKFAVRSEEKGFRRTRDVWFILADINWRTTPQDALCQIAFTSKFHSEDLQFQLHFFAHTRLCTHAHTRSLAHGPMDSRALVWAARCVLHATKSATRPQIRDQGCVVRKPHKRLKTLSQAFISAAHEFRTSS